MVFVHGQPGVGSDFDAVATLLSGDHRVIAPDRPGYGHSALQVLSMAENAQVIADLIEASEASPATLVGHSYGGGIASLVAASRPDIVRALVLVASVGRAESLNIFDRVLAAPVIGESVSAASLYALGHVLPRMRRVAALAPRGSMRRLRVSLPDSRYMQVASEHGRKVWRSFVFEQRALMREIGDVEASLRGIEVPTVVVAGTWDVVVPPLVARSIVSAVRGAELVMVDRIGHFVTRDAPGEVASAVRRAEARSAPGRGDPARAGVEEAHPPQARGDVRA
ncbi:MAG TPA: alpha/beta hydrolase [Acidimicrobiales bacterium]|nr:alpha/beta hydrolase [Acidimicrobiales bacterium]